MLHRLFSFFKANDSSRKNSNWQFLLLQHFTKMKCVSEHSRQNENYPLRRSLTKNPDCYFPSGSISKYASVTVVFAPYRIFSALYVFFPMKWKQTLKSNVSLSTSIHVHLPLILWISGQIPHDNTINQRKKFVTPFSEQEILPSPYQSERPPILSRQTAYQNP